MGSIPALRATSAPREEGFAYLEVASEEALGKPQTAQQRDVDSVVRSRGKRCKNNEHSEKDSHVVQITSLADPSLPAGA